VKLTVNFHLVPRLGICGVIPALLHTFSCHSAEVLVLYTISECRTIERKQDTIMI
jgi:hypothetical protein